MTNTEQSLTTSSNMYYSTTPTTESYLGDKNHNRIKTITIRQVDRGYFVEVGCQTFAITNKSELIALFIEYVNDPIGTEKKHAEDKLFL